VRPSAARPRQQRATARGAISSSSHYARGDEINAAAGTGFGASPVRQADKPPAEPVKNITSDGNIAVRHRSDLRRRYVTRASTCQFDHHRDRWGTIAAQTRHCCTAA
jgi:hypothetical protein